MNRRQRAAHEMVAEDVIALSGASLSHTISVIQNPKILRRILRRETQWSNGKPRKRLVKAVTLRLAELKRLNLRTCKYCGCTDDQGCPGGCEWATEDTCTVCNAPF